MQKQKYDYDFFVIGGGCGGLSFAKEASKFGAKGAIADFVRPSPQGNKWGLGGTSLNVGSIPKQLMHIAAQNGELHGQYANMGYNTANEKPKHEWYKMVSKIQNYIKNASWQHKLDLQSKEVKYYNAFASILDQNTVEKSGETEKVSAKFIIIAVGARPKFLEVEGSPQFVITSDDLFTLQKPPGKTLIVGGSYVALETAGILNSFGCNVTVIVRAKLMRGFDEEIVNKLETHCRNHGIKFIKSANVTKIVNNIGDGKKVFYRINGENQDKEEMFDTIILAIGRQAETQKLNLQRIGIKTKSNGKIVCKENDSTGIDNIFAIGDCVYKRPELVPISIKTGRLLAERLFNGKNKLMEYLNIPTTIFSTLEYGTIGFSEEDAIDIYGEENIKVYFSIFTPLEWNYADGREEDKGYCKLIVNLKKNEKVIGLHYLGPNAGEVVQGYAIAFLLNATKQDFDKASGIHPTCSEELIGMKQFKGSGKVAKESGC